MAMRMLRFLAATMVLALAVAGTTHAGDKKVLVSGDPPLTQDMLDDYCKLADWRFGSTLAKAGGVERLRELLVNDWKNGDAKRQKAVLADLKWWREDYPKLSPAERERLVARNAAQTQQYIREIEAIQMLKLQMWNDARQQHIRAMSNAQAKHHETMMIIINNLRPTGRYVYNPSTGRYDRWEP
jgi:hypothetical protein